MQTAKDTAEAFKYKIVVVSILDTLRMVVLALATSSTYSVVATSGWGSATGKPD